jgi:predicted PurR-regulated permease PerM
MKNVVFYIAIVLIAAFIVLSKTFAPIWLLILTLTLVWPYRKEKGARQVFLMSILLLLLYVIFHYFSILAPFIIGVGIAYILAPLVDLLEHKKIPRPVAILVFLLPLVAIVPLIFFLIFSGIINELQGLISKIPEAIQHIQRFSGVVVNKLVELGIEIDPNIITTTITTHLTNIISSLFVTIGQIGKGIGGIIILVYNIVIIPLSAYLFLSDRNEITHWFRNICGTQERVRIDEFIQRLNFSLARFFRGQILLIVIVGFIVGFTLWLLGIKYYLLLGVIAGICNIVPNIGYVLSFIPAILIGLLSPTPLVNVIKIVLVYVGEQLLENFYLGPVIIGRASRLHPVIVMIILILGGTTFGFWGLVLAIPVTIFVREFLNLFLDLSL